MTLSDSEVKKNITDICVAFYSERFSRKMKRGANGRRVDKGGGERL